MGACPRQLGCVHEGPSHTLSPHAVDTIKVRVQGPGGRGVEVVSHFEGIILDWLCLHL